MQSTFGPINGFSYFFAFLIFYIENKLEEPKLLALLLPNFTPPSLLPNFPFGWNYIPWRNTYTNSTLQNRPIKDKKSTLIKREKRIVKGKHFLDLLHEMKKIHTAFFFLKKTSKIQNRRLCACYHNYLTVCLYIPDDIAVIFSSLRYKEKSLNSRHIKNYIKLLKT